MDHSLQGASTRPLSQVAFVHVSIGGVVLFALVSGVAALAHFGAVYVLGAISTYVFASVPIVARIERHHPHTRFGSANIITLGRLIVTSLLAGLILEISISQTVVTSTAAWCFFAAATGSMILDGMDGPVARREGLASSFGARFDMEVDALQILVLSVVAFLLAKAGWWILIAGFLRYLFVAAAAVWPFLTAKLRDSWRRKTVAAIQGSVVTALLAPIITPPLSTAAAGIALALLMYSFTVDTFWLVRARGNSQ